MNPETLLIFHIDFNFEAWKKTTIMETLDFVAKLGYNAILWELENKVKWNTCPVAIHPEAMSKAEFREILDYSRSLGLEPIPLLQTIGHGEYILIHDEYAHMRELPEMHDCYCVSKPEVRSFLKNLIAEYVELFGDLKYFHLGGDEAYVFGKCPVCSEYEKNLLYGEHINELAEQLREKNIRPGIWNDMIMAHLETISNIPEHFIIWDWNYGDGLDTICPEGPFPTVKILMDAGFDIILCSASRSAIDSPFLPAWRTHESNIAGAAELTRNKKLIGNCVTSWAIRLVPMILQYPLLEIPPLILSGDGAFIENIIEEKARKYWGDISPDLREKLLEWKGALRMFTALQWHNLKDSLPAPEGYIETVLERMKHDCEFKEFCDTMKTYIPEYCKNLEELLPRLQNMNIFMETVHVALRIKLSFMHAVLLVITRETFTMDDLNRLEAAKSEATKYYNIDQCPISAQENAGLLFDPIIEYIRKRIDTYS